MAVQQTLTGEEAEHGRIRPDTLKFCAACGDHVLRSRWDDHEDHHLEQIRTVQAEAMELEEDEEEEPAEEVGGVYDIELNYTVRYSFRIPANTENQAEELAQERVLYPENCSGADLVHTDRRKVETVMSDDERLPEDWDPYGEERLWQAFERGEEGDS